MTRDALRPRILSALALQPMTCAFLSRCLGYSTRHEQRIIWASLVRLERNGWVRMVGREYQVIHSHSAKIRSQRTCA